MPPSLSELVAVEQVGLDQYVSKSLPIRMGNSLPIAYGGCTLSVAVSAAYATTAASVALYSVLGHYHGPASTTQKLHCKVERTRDTRSFATRRVQVSQTQADGSTRICLELLADFHTVEPSTMTYSAGPTSSYPKPSDCPPARSQVEAMVARGVISAAQAETYRTQFGIAEAFFTTRPCPNGVSSQNLAGALKDLATTQDGRRVADKTSAEWEAAREPLGTPGENMAALAFLMDGALSFVPLTHGGLWFDDVDACASLDFALRVFVPEVDMAAWHLRERTTSRGGGGLTYSEGRLWDGQGNMVASMTQQSILRLKAPIKPLL